MQEVNDLKMYLNRCVTSYKAGNITHYLPVWQKLTIDTEILSSVPSLPLDFEDLPMFSEADLHSKFSVSDDLLRKGVIKECQHEQGQFISPIFLTPKSDGSFRLILNLKKLNEHMSYVHFKMDTIHSVLSLITSN